MLDIVLDDISQRWKDKLSSNIWIKVDLVYVYPILTTTTAWLSHEAGGARQYFGSIDLSDVKIVVETKTVWGILRRNYLRDISTFEYCDPAFPNNFYDFVETAAGNALRCFDLDHKRHWNRYHRESNTLRV